MRGLATPRALVNYKTEGEKEMQTLTSKPTGVLIAILFCAAAVTTARSQDSLTPIDVKTLAARGEAIANQYPLAVELRDQQPDSSAQRGFNIGMAVAREDTLPGPGKDRACASLSSGEQAACRIAVSFAVERNRNAKFAERGSAILEAEPIFAKTRNATIDVFYRLGFDIGLAASEGQTLPGPGKDRIRDSLRLTAEREGFSTAVSITLERNRNAGLTATPNSGMREKVASDEIRCRGYSRPGGSEYVFVTINSRPSATGETLVTYEMAFTNGSQAAGARGEGLRPGECAWADRPIGDNGPLRIRFETVANAQLKQQLHGTPIDRSSTAAESYPDANTIPAYLKGENHYWSFGGVSNSGRGYFVATGNGYWKPAIAIGDVNRSPTEPAKRRGPLFPPKP